MQTFPFNLQQLKTVTGGTSNDGNVLTPEHITFDLNDGVAVTHVIGACEGGFEQPSM